jgi:hypothetical protein
MCRSWHYKEASQLTAKLLANWSEGALKSFPDRRKLWRDSFGIHFCYAWSPRVLALGKLPSWAFAATPSRRGATWGLPA